jgi:hypothetical protein
MTSTAVCRDCLAPLTWGLDEEHETMRIDPAHSFRPGRYFCDVSADALHHLHSCGHSHYPAEGCRNCEAALGRPRALTESRNRP